MNGIRVIKIIDEYTILINAGAKDGIKKDDILEIFVVGEPITDPITNEELGTLDIIKANLIVATVYPKMSICKNNELIYRDNTLIGGFAKAASLLTPSAEHKKLNIDSSQISGGLDDYDLKIEIGDLVRKALT